MHMVALTERSAMERVLKQVVSANTAQMADPAFVQELKAWIRFNEVQALRTRDAMLNQTAPQFGCRAGLTPHTHHDSS
jgi:hypothetical protein